MKNFVTMVFASCLGTVMAIGGVVLYLFLSVGSAISSGDVAKVEKNSIIKLDFSKPIPEQTDNIASGNFEFKTDKTIGLSDMVFAIKQAKTDKKIKGIYLELSGAAGGFATKKVIRDALEDFKSSGKFIVSYADYYSQGSYYMASVADEVIMNPLGGVDFMGFSAQITYLKGMLDKLGVKMQVFYAGDFKSATEPFRRTDMSEPNRLQVRAYIEGLYKHYLEAISASRGISVSDLRAYANELKLKDADDALRLKMVDKLQYKDQIIDGLKDRLGVDKKDDIEATGISTYFESVKNKKTKNEKSKIAVVYAEGSIVDGDGDAGSIGGKKYSKLLRKIRRDKDVKAIVLRINSGGGSAFASEEIWRELEVAKSEGKIVVATMGDVAASGGYYIASGAEKIFAEENTITGSIGVFGMIPNARELLEDKMGITMDTVKTGEFSGLSGGFYPLEGQAAEFVQESVDSIYSVFKQRVAAGRKMHVDSVHTIAQGRVWLGSKAKEIGLVDEHGGLADAISYAASETGLEKYKVVEYPEQEDKFTKLIKEFTGQSRVKSELKKELGVYYKYVEQLKELSLMKNPQARLPFTIEVH